MGIKNLNSFLKKHTTSGINEISIKKYENKLIGIDTSIFLYKFVYSGNYLQNFINQVLKFWKNKIIPIYVFDGKPTSDKSQTLLKRKKIKNGKKIKVSNLENENKELMDKFIDGKYIISKPSFDENDVMSIKYKKYLVKEELIEEIDNNNKEIEKISKSIIEISHDHITNLKKLFDILGVIYIQSDGESDILCTELMNDNIIDACLSDDMDFLTHNCKYLLRELNYHNNDCVEYNLEIILKELNLNIDQFIDMCILMGCDYTEKIPGIGPINAYKLIKKYKNIEEIVNHNRKYNVPQNFNYQAARDIFKTKQKTKYCKSEFIYKKIQWSELTEYLKELNFKNIDKLIHKINGINSIIGVSNKNTGKIQNYFKKKMPN